MQKAYIIIILYKTTSSSGAFMTQQVSQPCSGAKSHGHFMQCHPCTV